MSMKVNPHKMDLATRMKTYESVTNTYLIRRMPVVIRIDGRAFHNFTKNFDKPYDTILHNAMNLTLQYLCENIENCVIGYTQSDEISLILCDYTNLSTQAWFDNSLQKLVSVSASMATMKFNQEFADLAETDEDEQYFDRLGQPKLAMFDSRVFNLPEEEVVNYLIWRQQDATRNAIQLTAQAYFKHKDLIGLNTNQMQDKLFKEIGINFNNFPTQQKRGIACIKVAKYVRPDVLRDKWELDYETPIFSKDKEYINKILRKVRNRDE